MSGFLQVVGFVFCIAFIAGMVIPGVSCHIYFGTDAGAKKWHKEKADK